MIKSNTYKGSGHAESCAICLRLLLGHTLEAKVMCVLWTGPFCTAFTSHHL